MKIVFNVICVVSYLLVFTSGHLGAMITLKNNCHWAPIRLQVAIDVDPDKAQVPGNITDKPLENHAKIEIPELTIQPETKFSIRTVKDTVFHVRIATHGNARNSQIMVTVSNDVELELNDFGQGDIFIERALDIVNSTNKAMNVTIRHNRLKKDYANSRQLWQSASSIVFTGVPWTREMGSKSFNFLPQGTPPRGVGFDNNHVIAHYHSHLPLMSYTQERGVLVIDGPSETRLSFDSLLPMSGIRNTITIEDVSKKGMLALAMALHNRAGAQSSARGVSQDMLKKINQHLAPELRFVVRYEAQ